MRAVHRFLRNTFSVPMKRIALPDIIINVTNISLAELFYAISINELIFDRNISAEIFLFELARTKH